MYAVLHAGFSSPLKTKTAPCKCQAEKGDTHEAYPALLKLVPLQIAQISPQFISTKISSQFLFIGSLF